MLTRDQRHLANIKKVEKVKEEKDAQVRRNERMDRFLSTNANVEGNSNAALHQRRDQLTQAYTALGGNDPAYLSTPNNFSDIPRLEQAVVDLYESDATRGKGVRPQTGRLTMGQSESHGAVSNMLAQQQAERDHINAQQQYADLYNDIINGRTQQAVDGMDVPEINTMPTIMGMGNNMYGRPTQEQEAAGVTREDLQRLYDTQNREKNESNARDFAKNFPVLASLGGIIARPIESGIGVVQNLGEYATGKPLSRTYTPSQIMRETVTEGIDTKPGRMAYNVVNSLGDMGLALLTQNPAAIAAIMGTEKASDVMNDANERGLTADQIVGEGALSGASTALTEMIPFGGFLRGGTVAHGFVSEGLQEGAENILDNIFDLAVTSANGDIDKATLVMSYNAYVEAGYEPSQAVWETLKNYVGEVGTDIILGGLTGGLMQGVSNVTSGREFLSGNLNQVSQNQVIESLSPDAISPENFEAYSQVVDEIKKNHPEMTERLDSLMQEASSQIISDIESAAEYVLNSGDINAYNEFVQNVEQIKAQIPSLENNINLILSDINNDFSTSGNENVDIPSVQPEQRVSRRELNAAVRRAENTISKLSTFNIKNADLVTQEINNVLEPVLNSEGATQIEALNTLDNVLNDIDNRYANESVGINERSLNQDGFNAMHNVTDGRKIKVSKEMLHNIGLNNVTQLNKVTDTGTNNRIKFYKENTGNEGAVSLDSVWNEMVEQSGNVLPSVASGDQLQALVDYINEYKSGKGSEVNSISWSDSQSDFRSENERRIDDIADNLFDLIEDGKMTGEDYEKAMREMSELAKNDKALQDKVFNLLSEASDEYRAKRYNMDVDPDIENAESEEELGNIVDEIVESLDEITEDATYPTSQPGVQTGRLKESQTYTGTGEKSGMTQEEKVLHSEKAVRGETGGMLYQEVGEQESYEQAQKNLEEKGEEAEAQYLFHKKGWNQVDTDEAMTILKHTREEAQRIQANGGDATNEWEYAAELFVKIQTEATNHAQALQALAKWSRVRADGTLTAEGRLAAAIRAADRATKVSNSDPNLNAEVNQGKFQKHFEFKKEFVADFLKACNDFDAQKNNLSEREQAIGEARLAKMVKRQIPKKPSEIITSILMDDMLFSIRTLISRNAGGNAGLALVDQTITKLIAGGVDRAASRFTNMRTTTGLTLEGAKRYVGGFAKGVQRTAADYFKDDVNTWKPGQENDFEALIDENRRLFNTDGKSKILNNAAKCANFLDRIVSFGLTFGDNPFYTGAYEQSLYEFDKLREQGWFDKDAQGKPISDEKFELLKKSHSVINALTAVYQNDTAISRGLMNIKKGLSEASNGLAGLDFLTQAAMPFVKTPANVALTAFEYSPFGILKNAVQTLREVSSDYKRARGQQVVGDRTFNQQRFVRETSRNIVGSLLYLIAIGMAKSGLLTGAYSDDDDMKQAQREAGMQEYAFVSPFTGNQWQTSWIPVIGNSAVAGAATWDAINNSKDGNAVLEGLKAGASSQFENSMLQGLQRLFGTQSNYSSEGILQNVGNTIKSAGTQLIPSIVRQTAAALDPYQRDTRGIEENDRYINPIIASIPFLRENLQPRIGRTGEELEQNAGRNPVQKWLDNLVNPAIVTTPNAVPDAVRDEAMRLYDSLEGTDITAARGAFEPYVNVKQITTDDHTPTPEEYTRYQREAYGQMNSVAQTMIESDYYQNLTDLGKAKALAKIYEAVRDSVRCDTVDGNVADLDAAARIYNQEGADALIEYVMTGTYLNQMGLNNNQTNRDYILEQLESGNYDALEADMNTSQELSAAGFSENLTFKYNHAIQYIPSLTPTEFAETWNAIDSTISQNNTVSQDEILAYINQNPTSWNESDVNMYWQAFLQDPAYQPYFDAEEGIWKKQKV